MWDVSPWVAVWYSSLVGGCATTGSPLVPQKLTAQSVVEVRMAPVILLKFRHLGSLTMDSWALGGASVSLQQQESQNQLWRQRGL